MTDELLTGVSKVYGIPEGLKATRIAKGVLSENYALEVEGNRYFLKKYSYENEEKIRQIHAAKNYFFEGSIPIIMPLRTGNGDSYIQHDGAYYALFPFIAGKQLERDQLTPVAVDSMGQMLGKIHLRGKDAIKVVTSGFKPWRKEEFLEKVQLIEQELAKIQAPSVFDTLARESLTLKRKLVAENSKTFSDLAPPTDHLLHGDYLDHNLFFNDADEVTHVFDLEKSHYGPRTYELFRSMMYCFILSPHLEQDLANARQYLSAYRDVYPIETAELVAGLEVYRLKAIHSLWIESEHYLLGNTRPDQFLEQDVHRLRILDQDMQTFSKILLS